MTAKQKPLNFPKSLYITRLQQAIEKNDDEACEEFLTLDDKEFNELLLKANVWAILLSSNGFHSVKFLERVFKTLAPSQISHYILLSAPYDMQKFQKCFEQQIDKMDFMETTKFLISIDDAENLGKLFKIEKNIKIFKEVLITKYFNRHKNIWLYAIENYAFKCEELIKAFAKSLQ